MSERLKCPTEDRLRDSKTEVRPTALPNLLTLTITLTLTLVFER